MYILTRGRRWGDGDSADGDEDDAIHAAELSAAAAADLTLFFEVWFEFSVCSVSVYAADGCA